MNAKQAKAIRQTLRGALKIPKISAEYVTRVSKVMTREIEDDNGEKRTFRIEQLTTLLDAKSSRSLYQLTKRIAGAGKKPFGRSLRANNWGSTGELWAPTEGFFPDSRVMDVTPKPAESPDNTGGSGPDDGMLEAEPTDEQAQEG